MFRILYFVFRICWTRPVRNRRPFSHLTWCCWLFLAGTVLCQDAEVAVEEPPYYIGEPVTVRIVVRDLDESPKPTVDAKSSPGLTLRLASMEPSVSSSVQIVQDSITGRREMRREKTVVFPIDYEVTANQPGEYTVGPFVIAQGKKKVEARSIKLTFQDVPLDPEMRVRLELTDRPIYPDQRVPVKIEWWFAGNLNNVNRLRIQSPLFDQFRFAPDKRPAPRSSALPVETAAGRLELEAEVRSEVEGAQKFTVVSAVRSLIPDRPGEYSLPPITATVRRVTRWARSASPFDDFGFGGSLFRDLMGEGRRPSEVALSRSVGQPLKLVVKPFPQEGRPASFAGAVGRGFALDASADRTVVNVGDPVSLTLTLRGEGNLDNVGLPPLSSEQGLPPRQFRVPDGDLSGSYDQEAKRFTFTVRVEQESVTEIPGIAFSWFDPADEKYYTTRSKPIALRVMPAKIVSAADVVSGGRQTSEKESPGRGVAARTQETATGETPRELSFSGADLSIEDNAGVLLRDYRPSHGIVWQSVFYVSGFVLIAMAFLERRRKDIPAEVLRRRKALRDHCRRLEKARRAPPREGAAEIAASLRAILAELPSAPRQDAESIIATCDSIVYAPQRSEVELSDPSLPDRAVAAAEQMIKVGE